MSSSRIIAALHSMIYTMNKKLIILSLAILSIAGTTFAATVGTTSNSTVE